MIPHPQAQQPYLLPFHQLHPGQQRPTRGDQIVDEQHALPWLDGGPGDAQPVPPRLVAFVLLRVWMFRESFLLDTTQLYLDNTHK